jgi:acyl-coenzyme A thioesterase PaaI-like protein
VAQAYGVWTETVQKLMSYRYLGCRSVLGEDYDALGRMAVRSDLRHGEGLLGAPIAIAMLDAAGIAVDRHWQLALTHVGIQLCGPVSEDVTAVAVHGSMTRRARTQIFTEARITAEGDPNRLLGLGTADWTVISTTGTGFEYVDPGPGVPDTEELPPLSSAYGARLQAHGCYVVDELTPEFGGALLHHGPILVALEAAAIHASGQVRHVQSLDVRIVKAGRTGPFVATASVESQAAGSILVSVRMHQDHDEADVVATALLRAAA